MRDPHPHAVPGDSCRHPPRRLVQCAPHIKFAPGLASGSAAQRLCSSTARQLNVSASQRRCSATSQHLNGAAAQRLNISTALQRNVSATQRFCNLSASGGVRTVEVLAQARTGRTRNPIHLWFQSRSAAAVDFGHAGRGETAIACRWVLLLWNQWDSNFIQGMRKHRGGAANRLLQAVAPCAQKHRQRYRFLTLGATGMRGKSGLAERTVVAWQSAARQ